MTVQIKNLLSELNAIQAKLPELRELFWLKIDRYNTVDQQHGQAFDERFEQQHSKLVRTIESFTAFIEKSFAPTADELAKESAVQKLCTELTGFNDLNEEVKKALLDREIKIQRNAVKTPKETIVRQSGNKKTPLLLRVIFSDGTEIAENKATHTFIKTIEKIGIQRVFKLKMGREIIREDTNFKGNSVKLKKCENYYIDIHSSTYEKKMYLDKISQQLKLNLKVQTLER